MASFLLPSSLALLFLFVTAAAALRPTAVKRDLMNLKDEEGHWVVAELAQFAVDEVNGKRKSDYEKANGQEMPPKDWFLYQNPLSALEETVGTDTTKFTLDIDLLKNANTIHGSIEAVLAVNDSGELKLDSWKPI